MMVYNEEKILIGVGDCIHDAFTKSGMSYAEFTKKSGVKKYTMENYYCGTQVPNLKTLMALCNVFNMRIEELIGVGK